MHYIQSTFNEIVNIFFHGRVPNKGITRNFYPDGPWTYCCKIHPRQSQLKVKVNLFFHAGDADEDTRDFYSTLTALDNSTLSYSSFKAVFFLLVPTPPPGYVHTASGSRAQQGHTELFYASCTAAFPTVLACNRHNKYLQRLVQERNYLRRLYQGHSSPHFLTWELTKQFLSTRDILAVIDFSLS